MAFPRSLSLRWLQIITNFNFTVEYVKAENHTDVDFLSRHIGTENKDENKKDDQENEEDEETNDLIIHHIASNTTDDLISEESFRQAQQEDEHIEEVKRWIETQQIPTKEQLTQMPIELRQYIGIIPALRILADGLLVRKKINRRTHRDERATSIHSTESPEKNNPSIASTSRTYSSTQTIPPHNAKILDANSDENNKNSHSELPDLPKENPFSWGKSQSPERDPILVSMQPTNGSPLS